MNTTPDDFKEPGNLRFLRILVTILTLSMIAGLVTVIALIVIKFPSAISNTAVPDEIFLPEGVEASTFTRGDDWYAIVTKTDEILIYNIDDNSLRQTIQINPY